MGGAGAVALSVYNCGLLLKQLYNAVVSAAVGFAGATFPFSYQNIYGYIF